MSEVITVEMIDELKANGYKLTTGSKSRSPWWMLQAYGSNSQPNDCDTFAAAARAAWEHYQASKRPAKPEYPSGWVCIGGIGRKVIDVFPGDAVDWWVRTEADNGETLTVRSTLAVVCPPCPTPPQEWELTGEVKDTFAVGEAYINIYADGVVLVTCRDKCDQPDGLRWGVRKIKPSVYTADTFPKGEVWVRAKGTNTRYLVTGVEEDAILYGGVIRQFSYLANGQHGDKYEMSTDGGITWRAARPE